MAETGRSAPRKLLIGLIGAPIAHSASPAMHEAAAARARHARLLPPHRGRGRRPRRALRLMLEGVRRLGFAGVNVTFPYKEAVVPLLDELSPAAAAIGAVNTIVVERTAGSSATTPMPSGFAHALRRDRPKGRRARPVALIGAGGVGKAIAFALAARGAARAAHLRPRPRQGGGARRGARAARAGARLRRRSRRRSRARAASSTARRSACCRTATARCPSRSCARDLWVADAVYTPLWTPLLKAARARGAPVMTGRELAIFQAHRRLRALLRRRAVARGDERGLRRRHGGARRSRRRPDGSRRGLRGGAHQREDGQDERMEDRGRVAPSRPGSAGGALAQTGGADQARRRRRALGRRRDRRHQLEERHRPRRRRDQRQGRHPRPQDRDHPLRHADQPGHRPRRRCRRRSTSTPMSLLGPVFSGSIRSRLQIAQQAEHRRRSSAARRPS